MRKSKYMIKMINIWAYGGQVPSDVSAPRWNAICKFIQKNFDDLRIAPWQTQLYLYNRDITINNSLRITNMTKKFLTAKETEGMTLEQFQAAMREGRVEVRREGSGEVTADMVTMNGRFSCEWLT